MRLLLLYLIFNFAFMQTKKEIDNYVFWICRYYRNKNINVDLVSSIITVESQYNVNAVSSKNAFNLMQLRKDAIIDVIKNNPEHCTNWNVTTVRTNWKKNIWAGINYLNQQFINAKDNITNALRMYNGGAKGYYRVKNYQVKVLKLYYKKKEEK